MPLGKISHLICWQYKQDSVKLFSLKNHSRACVVFPALCSAAVCTPFPFAAKAQDPNIPGGPPALSFPPTRVPLFWAGTKSEGTVPSAGTPADYQSALALSRTSWQGHLGPAGDRDGCARGRWAREGPSRSSPPQRPRSQLQVKELGGTRVLLRNKLPCFSINI